MQKTSMNLQKTDKKNCGDRVCLKPGIVVRRTATVDATMVGEQVVVDGHGDVHHKGTAESFAMSVHSLCAVVHRVCDQLVEF